MKRMTRERRLKLQLEQVVEACFARTAGPPRDALPPGLRDAALVASAWASIADGETESSWLDRTNLRFGSPEIAERALAAAAGDDFEIGGAIDALWEAGCLLYTSPSPRDS